MNNERNFCQRCGKRLGKNDWDIHTCTPPVEQAQKPEGHQEPVARKKHEPTIDLDKYAGTYGGYTSPPQRQPLTPESVFQIADQHPVEGFDPDIMAFARAIEAAHGIKGEA